MLADVILLILLTTLLAASAFFSGTETALFSLSRQQRRRLRESGVAGAAAASLLDQTRPLLITLLLGNMTVNVLYFVTGTVLLFHFQDQLTPHPIIVGVVSLLPLVTLILIGEVIPKLVASRLTHGWTMVAALPLAVLHRGIAPLRVVLDVAVIEPMARLIAPRHKPQTMSTHDLASLLQLSLQEGIIDESEQHMLQQVLSFSRLKVRDLMTPRVDIHAYDLHDDPDQLINVIRKSQRSRIPVYRDDLDHILGVIYARQALLQLPRNRRAVRPLIQNVRFVPELQRADALMADFRDSGTTFAIVVDEFGGTAGLVSLEDIVERMVGDIAATHEPQPVPPIKPLDDRRWRVNADLSIHEWPEHHGPIHPPRGVGTMGGLVMAAFGRLPRVGEHVRIGSLDFHVAEMRGRRLTWLIVESPKTPHDDGETAHG